MSGLTFVLVCCSCGGTKFERPQHGPHRPVYCDNCYQVISKTQRINDWRKRNIEHARTQRTDYRRKLKRAVIAGYGNRCICCGEERWEFLTVEHKHGDGKKHRDSLSSQIVLYNQIIREKFPEKYTILCMNCNCSRGWYGYCPHERP